MAENLIGQKFGRLTVISFSDKKDGTRNKWYLCQCECGNKTDAIGIKLKIGHKKSCGCLISISAKNKPKVFNKLHHAWSGYEDISGSQWARIKTSAEKRKIEFSITIEQAWEEWVKQDGKCALSGQELYLAKNYKELHDGKNTASIDRINSDKGYIIDNIQWLHVDVNYMKQWFDQKYFIDTCEKIVNNKKRLEPAFK